MTSAKALRQQKTPCGWNRVENRFGRKQDLKCQVLGLSESVADQMVDNSRGYYKDFASFPMSY